jgi:hypothetical protein
MAYAKPIFQPVNAAHQHAGQLNSLLQETWVTDLTLSSAFANSAGIEAIAPALSASAPYTRAFIGIRNGSTTAQSLLSLLKLGVDLYCVDTATRSRIFHPKLFMGRGSARARVVIGSANLTHPGLFNNIEAGADIELDLNENADREFVEGFLDGFQLLISNFPEHCFHISSARQIIDLMRQGLLEDERNPKTNTALGVGNQGAKTSKASIPLPFKAPPKRKYKPVRKPQLAHSASNISAPLPYGQLVWVKPKLPETDLQLNAGHAPGVLRLTQARYEVNGQRINQTSYFRNQVFSQLNWTFDATANKEVSVAPISLVIAGVYVGDFDLPLSHKAAWEANQNNYTTGLHWENATTHIRHQGLVGRTLRIYAPPRSQSRFIVEID